MVHTIQKYDIQGIRGKERGLKGVQRAMPTIIHTIASGEHITCIRHRSEGEREEVGEGVGLKRIIVRWERRKKGRKKGKGEEKGREVGFDT